MGLLKPLPGSARRGGQWLCCHLSLHPLPRPAGLAGAKGPPSSPLLTLPRGLLVLTVQATPLHPVAPSWARTWQGLAGRPARGLRGRAGLRGAGLAATVRLPQGLGEGGSVRDNGLAEPVHGQHQGHGCPPPPPTCKETARLSAPRRRRRRRLSRDEPPPRGCEPAPRKQTAEPSRGDPSGSRRWQRLGSGVCVCGSGGSGIGFLPPQPRWQAPLPPAPAGLPPVTTQRDEGRARLRFQAASGGPRGAERDRGLLRHGSGEDANFGGCGAPQTGGRSRPGVVRRERGRGEGHKVKRAHGGGEARRSAPEQGRERASLGIWLSLLST